MHIEKLHRDSQVLDVTFSSLLHTAEGHRQAALLGGRHRADHNIPSRDTL